MITIIPAIDIIGGRCVRLRQGDYAQVTRYEAHPVDVARRYEEAGVRRLHLVDLDGAKSSRPENLKILEEVAHATRLDIEWGGGIKSTEALRQVLDCGAQRVICGSVAVTDPALFGEWLGCFGARHVILGADVRDGYVATHGWLERSQLQAEELIAHFVPFGLSQVICTDISKDGMLEGPSFALYVSLRERFPEVEFTVSGGIASVADIERVEGLGLPNVIVGKALYEGHITLKDLERWLPKE